MMKSRTNRKPGFYAQLLTPVLLLIISRGSLAGPPGPPALCVSVEGTNVILNWKAVPQVAGYELYYAPYPGATPISSIDLGDRTLFSRKLPPGSAFYVALKSYNNEGVSAYSNIEHFRVPDDAAGLPQVTFLFGDLLAASASSEIRLATSRTEAFFASQSFPKFQPSVVVHAHDDYEDLLDAYVSAVTVCLANSLGLSIRDSGLSLSDANDNRGGGNGQGQAFGNHLFINAANTFWRTAASEAHKNRTVAHELFHVLQYQLVDGEFFRGPNTEVPRGGPRWLIEGSAELAGYMMLDWVGLSDFDSDLASSTAAAARSSYSLKDLENSPGFYSLGNAYQIGFTAVSFLSRELSEYLAFYSYISNEVPWEEAFIQAFGKDINTFYAEFKAYADRGY